MFNYKLSAVVCIFMSSLVSHSALANSLKGQTVHICGDGSGWPPYTYVKPGTENVVQGYDVDVITEIFAQHGIKAEFAMPSWKQCLTHTENGEQFQLALSSSYSDERAEKFLFTRKYYSSVQSYFYSKARYLDPPEIKSASDLFLYGSVCGRYSYNYEGTGVLKNSQILQAGKTYKALISRTLNEDCAFFIARPSIILGFSLIGQKLIDNEKIGYAPIPKANVDDFYMLISKKYPYAQELKMILDDGILRMEKSGRLKEILDGYYSKMNS